MRYACAIIALFLFSTSFSQGQELSYDLALKLFETNSPKLLAAKQYLIKRITESDSYSNLSNPELSYERESINSGDELEEVISVEQNLQILGQPFVKSSISRLESEAFTKLYEQELNEYYTEFRNEFINLILARELKDAFNETFSTVKNAYDAASERFKEGNVSGFELSRFRVALNDYRKETDEINNAYLSSIADFIDELYGSDQLERQYETGIEQILIIGSLETETQIPNLIQLQSEAILNRPDLKAIELLIESKDKRLTVEQLNRFPDLSVGGGYKKVKGVGNGFVLGLSLELPLFYMNGNEVQLAEIEIEESEIEYNSKRKQILLECYTVYNKLIALDNQLKEFGKGHSETDILQTAVLLYSEGQISLVELIDAAEAHRDDKKLYYQTLYEYNATTNELNKVLGKTKVGNK